LLSRFTAKHPSVLATQVTVPANGLQHVFCAAFRSPKGNITLAVVNDAPTEFELNVTWTGTPPSRQFFRYRYSKPQYDRADVKVDPEPGFSPAPGSAWTDSLPPDSLTIYSTYELRNSDPGVVTDEAEHPIH
jgi:hypothetical protein